MVVAGFCLVLSTVVILLCGEIGREVLVEVADVDPR